MYYLIDSDELVSYSGTDYRGEKHWWLQHGETVYDCTAEQYWEVHQNPPYDTGKKTKWYGWKGKLTTGFFRLNGEGSGYETQKKIR